MNLDGRLVGAAKIWVWRTLDSLDGRDTLAIGDSWTLGWREYLFDGWIHQKNGLHYHT